MKDLPGLKRQQVQKACEALLTHVKKQKVSATDLLEDDEILYLVRTSLNLQEHDVILSGRRRKLSVTPSLKLKLAADHCFAEDPHQ